MVKANFPQIALDSGSAGICVLREERINFRKFPFRLQKIEYITQRMQKAVQKGKTDEEKVQLRNKEFESIKK